MGRIRMRIPMLVVVLTAALLTGTAAAAPPLNDNFASATELQGVEVFASGTNKDATKEAGEPNHAGKAGGASVWHRWTAPASGKATISTCDSDFDTLLAAYTGSALNALTEVAANDDATCDLASSVSFQAAKGETYRIAVDGVAGDVGTYHLLLRLAPPNDDYADAVTLSGDQGAVDGTTAGASHEPEEPDYLTRSVWYRWAAPSTGWATFEACGGALHPGLAAYTGTTLATLQSVDTHYNGCADGAARITFAATEGVTYSLVVDSYEETGDFALAWNRNAPPPEAPWSRDYPTISGTAREGATLTGSDGEWGGTPPFSFSYAWWSCDANDDCGRITGANAKTYVPSAADVGKHLYLQVIATNVAGSDYAFSEGTAAVRARGPRLASPPFINGAPRVGLIIDAASGAWTGPQPIQYAYQWQLCDAAGANCRDLPNEIGIVFEVGRAHVGSRLRVVVTATNVDGSVSAASEPTAVVPTPRATRAARCVVPNVRGRTLVRAKALLRRAGCVTGSVRRAFSSSMRRGRVLSQTPRAGARVRRGAKVKLVLSKGAKR
jgi:hypothetical protein